MRIILINNSFDLLINFSEESVRINVIHNTFFRFNTEEKITINT